MNNRHDGKLNEYIRIDEVREIRENVKNMSGYSYGKMTDSSLEINRIHKQNSEQTSKIRILEKELK